jgi:hypothetical protein
MHPAPHSTVQTIVQQFTDLVASDLAGTGAMLSLETDTDEGLDDMGSRAPAA